MGADTSVISDFGLRIADLKKNPIFAREFAGIAQLVEHNLAKVRVAGSSPVSRSKSRPSASLRATFLFIMFRF